MTSTFNPTRPENIVIPPTRYRAAALDDFAGMQIQECICGHLILGPKGTGKTHLAAAIFNGVKGERIFAEARHWFEAIRAEYDKDRPAHPVLTPEEDLTFERPYRPDFHEGPVIIKRRSILARVLAASIIAIDDYGRTKGTDWEEEIATDILGLRVDNLKPIIITSNLSLSQIKNRNDRFFDRLRYLNHIVLDGNSLRTIQ